MSGHDEEAGRREQVLAVAERLMLARGSLNVSLNEIAQELSVSRSLIYVYFDGVPQIVDELFSEQLTKLHRISNAMRIEHPAFRTRTLALAREYLHHLSQRGHVILMALRERNQDSPLSPRSVLLFRRLLLMVARDLRRELQLDPRAALVALELLSAIPEALARLNRVKTVGEAVAIATCDRLIGAALDALAVRGFASG